jgi:hypothetical protein
MTDIASHSFLFGRLVKDNSKTASGTRPSLPINGSVSAVGGRSDSNFELAGARGELCGAPRLVRRHLMNLPRRKFLHLAAGAAALPVLPLIAGAQTYPARPVRIIVGFPLGGGATLSHV